VSRRAKRLAHLRIIECADPTGAKLLFRRSELRIGRRNGCILQAKQRRAATAILGFAAAYIGKEGEHDGCFGDELLTERSLGEESLRFRIPDNDDLIGLQVPGRWRKLRRRKDRLDLLLFNGGGAEGAYRAPSVDDIRKLHGAWLLPDNNYEESIIRHPRH
jgi:hypothetical protein